MHGPLPSIPAGRALAIALAVLASLCGAGCTKSILADRITRAPNQQSVPDPLGKMMADLVPVLDGHFYSLATRIPVGPPAAALAVAVLEPRDYGFVFRPVYMKNDGTDAKAPESTFAISATGEAIAPKATLFVLHGIMTRKEAMLHWAFFLAQKGYRIVLVDLRGHGASTGDTISYGARETADLTQVLDEFFRRGLTTGRIGVLGLSYGGSIAIQWAARDSRIAAAAALAPNSDARVAIREFAHALMPKVIDRVSPRTLAGAFELAAKRGGFTWEETDVLAAARTLRFSILLLHGSNDTWIPKVHSERILAAAPVGSRLLVTEDTHISISILLEPNADPVAAWFDQALAP